MTLFSDFLKILGVQHTVLFSDTQFKTMPFQTLFGLGNLLKTYGVESQGIRFSDKTSILELPTPFLADLIGGFVIVTSIDKDYVTYLSQGQQEKVSIEQFLNAFSGVAMVAETSSKSCEPEYRKHRLMELIGYAKNWALISGCILLFAWLVFQSGVWTNLSTALLLLINLAGIWLSLMLVLKGLNIKTKAADHVCGIIEDGGCDDVVHSSGASFFGIFKWSEVGLTYFSVTLIAMLIMPRALPWLGLLNLCCLPFTFWSVWYQKFKAKRWCTLCLSVQLSLWLQFFCYLGGGWLYNMFPIKIEFIIIVLIYATTLLLINFIDNRIDSIRNGNLAN